MSLLGTKGKFAIVKTIADFTDQRPFWLRSRPTGQQVKQRVWDQLPAIRTVMTSSFSCQKAQVDKSGGNPLGQFQVTRRVWMNGIGFEIGIGQDLGEYGGHQRHAFFLGEFRVNRRIRQHADRGAEWREFRGRDQHHRRAGLLDGFQDRADVFFRFGFRLALQEIVTADLDCKRRGEPPR